jgi:polyisoprenoid-binding protein YceI
MRFAAAALAFALAAAPAVAEDKWVIDKSHAHVTFMADHLGFSVVHGQFREFDADISFSPDEIEKTSLRFTIKADSVDTFWPRRDEHIRSADFLNVAVHPEITFVSTSVVKTSDTTADVTGDLTMIGVTKPVTFKATLNKLGQNPFTQAPLAGFTVTGEIRRAEWGMTYGGDAFAAVVPVRVDLELTPGS